MEVDSLIKLSSVSPRIDKDMLSLVRLAPLLSSRPVVWPEIYEDNSSREFATSRGIKSDRERQIPESIETVEVTHRARYQFIRDILLSPDGPSFKTLLDYGCGSGYGTHILSPCAEITIGADLDHDLLLYADGTFGTERTFFVPTNSLTSNECVDCITCVEMIEHVSLQTGQALLNRFFEFLKPGGELVITTPRRPYGNPYHLHEYEFSELREYLVTSGFDVVAVFGQTYKTFKSIDEMREAYENIPKFTMIFHCRKPYNLGDY